MTATHEALHVAFPDLTGDAPGGHNNPVGDYLFRAATIDISDRLFGQHATDENISMAEDLNRAQENPDFIESGINLSGIATAGQVLSALQNNSNNIRSFLDPKGQSPDTQYDAPFANWPGSSGSTSVASNGPDSTNTPFANWPGSSGSTSVASNGADSTNTPFENMP
ncbi:hypothetical protein, partial [Methylorubrum podarium]|uniref:hypothetical protein n=1 Tax=Methylorubrum podarium TaxID=200476 RepID=UPI001EE35C3D